MFYNGNNKSSMKEELIKILKRNDLFDNKTYEQQADEILLLFSVNVSNSSDFELQRLFNWLQDAKREPAQTKFTSGMTRNVAREIEYLIKH